MFRYVALSWDYKAPPLANSAEILLKRLAAQRQGYAVKFTQPGLRVLCAGCRVGGLDAYLLADHQGVVLGRTFYRDTYKPVTSFSAAESRRIAQSSCRSLIEDFWGSYVAFVCDEPSGRLLTLRDPSGVLRCFTFLAQGVRIFCSHLEDCEYLKTEFTIDLEYVAAELTSRAMMGWERTGLREVLSVPAGRCLETGSGASSSRVLWNPVTVAEDAILDEATAVRVIRQSVESCTRAWCMGHQRLVLLLSGGLDSSIVLSCLQNWRESPSIICLHYHYPSLAGDERYYARLAATAARCELVEHQRSTDFSLESLLRLPRSARPSANSTDQLQFIPFMTSFARERTASGIVLGQLGDQLFGRSLDSVAALDYAWLNGISSGLVGVAADAARIRSEAAGSALLRAALFGLMARHGFARAAKRWFPQRIERNPFVSTRGLSALNYQFKDVWLSSSTNVPLGKLLHIGSVLTSQAYFDPISTPDDPEWVTPLQSQPVIEACLRTPIYMLFRGGWDRYIARRAFSASVPYEIICRPLKSSAAEQRRAVVARSIPFIRDLLLGGFLRSVGLLDCASVERSLRGDAALANHHLLMRCLWTEAWARVWLGRQSIGARDTAFQGSEVHISRNVGSARAKARSNAQQQAMK